MQIIDVPSWEKFEENLSSVREISTEGRFLFRGQTHSCWALETTLERSQHREMSFAHYYRIISVIKSQIQAFTGRAWQIPDFCEIRQRTADYDPFSVDLTFGRFPGYDYMAYLRHHGFPSPLLDWTASPYIAAYFAFRKPVNGSVAIYVYLEKPANVKAWSSGETQIHSLGPHVQTHQRHFLQQSTYTMCLAYSFQAREWRFVAHETVFSRNVPNQDLLWKFILPSTERLKVLSALDHYNLNAFSLFESEESLMEMLAFRQLDLDARKPPGNQI